MHTFLQMYVACLLLCCPVLVVSRGVLFSRISESSTTSQTQTTLLTRAVLVGAQPIVARPLAEEVAAQVQGPVLVLHRLGTAPRHVNASVMIAPLHVTE